MEDREYKKRQAAARDLIKLFGSKAKEVSVDVAKAVAHLCDDPTVESDVLRRINRDLRAQLAEQAKEIEQLREASTTCVTCHSKMCDNLASSKFPINSLGNMALNQPTAIEGGE